MERIAVSLDDGTVAVLSFCTRGRSPTLPFGATWTDKDDGYWTREASDDNVAAEVMKTFHGDGIATPVSWRRMPEGPPTDRTYRDAWVDRNGRIDHDMVKARRIHLAELRKARDRELTLFDAQWMRAMETNDTELAGAIALRKKALREMPERVKPLLDAAGSVDELKLVR